MNRHNLNRLLLIILAMAVLASCGAESIQTKESIAAMTVTDCMGRQVDIPAEPRRIACLYASTAHIIAMLGDADKIVGSPDGVRRDLLMQIIRPDIAEIAVPYSSSGINVEELLRIDADVAILRSSTAMNESEVEKLEKLGIPYVVVDYSSIEGLKEAIRVVGNVLDKQERAQAYIDHMDSTLAYVAERMTGVTEKPRVYHAANQASRTDMAGGICHEITTLAGIINVSADEGGLLGTGGTAETTLEQIYEWDPEAIICNDPNTTAYMLTGSKWAGLGAVQAGRVYTLPVGATRWVHQGSMEPHMATLFLARQFHPERFAELDIVQYTKDHYRDHFSLELDDDMVIKILSGVGMRDAKSDVHSLE